MAKKATTILARATCAVAASTALMMLLAGCFVIPLVDGRSPFDDPGGSSNADIEAAVPLIQAALDEVDTDGGAWVFEAYAGSDPCSGPCNLHVVASVQPNDADTGVPAEVLRAVLVAVVPAAEEADVNVTIAPGYSELSQKANFEYAVEELFGSEADARWETEAYEIKKYFDFEIQAHTRSHIDVLAAMGLG